MLSLSAGVFLTYKAGLEKLTNANRSISTGNDRLFIPPAYEVCHVRMPWGYNVFVFSVCVCVSVNNFRVRSITLKPLDIFS